MNWNWRSRSHVAIDLVDIDYSKPIILDYTFMIVTIVYTLYAYNFRTPIDFASASLKIWPHFAGTYHKLLLSGSEY